MNFTILPAGASIPSVIGMEAFLITDEWDDWFLYSTMYSLVITSGKDRITVVGNIKIGQFGMEEKQRRPAIPGEFESLGENFFSLGQDDSYYEELNKLGSEIRDEVLRALCDIALNQELFQR